MSEIANRSSWKTVPLPSQRARLNVRRTFSEEEYSLLSRGFIPQAMEDKWFIFLEDNILSFHRSWTGFCIYQVKLTDDHTIEEAWVNRNSEQYGGTDSLADENSLLFLINRFLLGN